MGMGPMTGRGAGPCGGYGAPGWGNPVSGRGFAPGRMWGGAWGGRGHRNWYHATGVPGWARFGAGPAWDYGPHAEAPAAEPEIEMLRQQAEWLKGQLDAIAQRIAELGKEE